MNECNTIKTDIIIERRSYQFDQKNRISFWDTIFEYQNQF